MAEFTLHIYKTKFALLLLATLIVGFWGGKYWQDRHHDMDINQLRENSSEYKLINPVLLLDNSELTFHEFDHLKGEVEKYLSDKDENKATSVSVYFRELNTGKWWGINEKELYVPSSMLKIGTLIAYLKMARDDDALLSKVVPYSPKYDDGQYYQPTRLLKAGTYPIRTLLYETIVESENNAVKVLDQLKPNEVLGVYNDLNLPNPLYDPNDGDFMSPEEYSRLFRVLYNATYLPRSYSEEALKILTMTKFNGGLVSGVGSTTVAHKFGEHTKVVNDKVAERQLHDCGIVYHPGSPYFICVMTRGGDFDSLQKVIAGVSKVVHENLNK